MPWIGIECKQDAGELAKWAAYVRRAGGVGVADLLERCARQVSGAGSAVNGVDRLREVEARAYAEGMRKSAEAANRLRRVFGGVMATGADAADLMSRIGLDGWSGGSASGDKNGGMAKKRRARGDPGSVAGGGEVVAERGPPPLTGAQTLARDARYGSTWEGWAGAELVARGFKIRHVARGLGMEVRECWRHVSGWTRHWKREGLDGRQFPGPREGWEDRLELADARARGVGLRGAEVRLNGTRDAGDAMPEDAVLGVLGKDRL